MKMRGSATCLFLLSSLAASCGTEDSPQPLRCLPGQTQLCYGPGACQGAQQCLPDGNAYSACDCGAPEAEGGAAGSSSEGNSEGGMAVVAGQGSMPSGHVAGAGSSVSAGGATAGALNDPAAGMSGDAAGGADGPGHAFALGWARAVTTGATPQEIVADPRGGFHLSGALTTANFGNGEVKGNWFAADRLADGSHVAARTLSYSNTPALYQAVHVGAKGTFVSVGGVDSYYDDLTYDTNELRITANPGFVRAYGANKKTAYVSYSFTFAVGGEGQVFYSSPSQIPFDGTNAGTTVVFHPDGAVGWSSLEKPQAGVFLGSGNLLMVGSLAGAQDFGGGPVTGSTYFVERDASGNHVASWGLDVPFPQNDYLNTVPPPRLRATPAYVAIEGEIRNNGLPTSLGGFELALTASRGWLALSMDRAGHYRYAGVWPTVVSDSGAALTPRIHATTDAHGRTFICGNFWRHFTGFGQTFTALGTTDKDSDIVLAALDADGSVLFAKTFGGAGADTCADIALDSTGGVLITGQYQTSLDFGAGPLEAAPHLTTDLPTLYIARFAVEE